MDIKRLTPELSVTPQIAPADVGAIAEAGFRAIICNRPDGEGADQATVEEIEVAAKPLGLAVRYLPVNTGMVTDEAAEFFDAAMRELPNPVLAYCRSGTRSVTLWALSQGAQRPLPEILETAKAAGYDMSGVVRRIASGGRTPTAQADARYEVVIVGGGAAGIAVASSLRARDPGLEIAIIDPADIHYYQPGWTMVGAGIFDAAVTARTMASLIPRRRPLDQVGRRGLRAQGQLRHPRWLPGGGVRSAGRLPGAEARLAEGRRVGRHARPQRRDLELSLRPRPLYLGACAELPRRAGRLHASRRCRSNAPARRRR